MVISTSIVGMRIDDIRHHVDERWTMAYAASLGDCLPAYMDTTRADGVVAHPVFAVCPEWPAIVASRDGSIADGVTAAEVLTSVHATHDTTIHRLIRPGDELTTSLELVGMQQIRPGAKSTTRLTTVDGDGMRSQPRHKTASTWRSLRPGPINRTQTDRCRSQLCEQETRSR